MKKFNEFINENASNKDYYPLISNIIDTLKMDPGSILESEPEVFEYIADEISKFCQKPNDSSCQKTKVWYSIRNGGDGSAYPIWFLTKEESEYDQENLWEGWGETCNGSVETYIGSDIYQSAIENSEEQKSERGL